MKIAKFTAAIALALGLTTFAFAGNPKTDTRSAEVKAEKPTTAETNDPPALYWYEVTYNAQHMGGAVLNADAFIDEGEKEEISSPCAPGTQRDCLRGFAEPLDTFPSEDAGTDQIKKSL